jgi:hypothetical protein
MQRIRERTIESRRRNVLLGLPAALAGIVLTRGAALAEKRKPSFVPEEQLEKLDTSKFANPTRITNKWLPMKPGTRFTYDGTTTDDKGKVVPHQIIISVTDLTKTIAVLETLVTYDLDYSDGELVEAELAFYAQDDDGNVWRMGEYPEEYVKGKVDAAPAWLAGIQGGRAGIMMKADPRPGTPSYSQGYGPKVNWTDRGQVLEMGRETVAGGKRYTDVLVIRESSLEEEQLDAAQLKYYAPNVGNIKVGWQGTGDKTKEVLDLTRVEQLTEQQMTELREKALAMEKSAYRHSRTVYARTSPMKQVGK